MKFHSSWRSKLGVPLGLTAACLLVACAGAPPPPPLAEPEKSVLEGAVVTPSEDEAENQDWATPKPTDTPSSPKAEKESWGDKTVHKLDAERLAELDRFIDSALQAGGIPGAAVSLVQDGAVILEKGYGLRQVGKPNKVKPKTLFLIGSTTEALTTLLLARLADEDKFAWNMPLENILPEFRLADPKTSKQVTMFHTVCACMGVPQPDMEFAFEYARASIEQRLDSLKNWTPPVDFGKTFQRSDTMVSAGAYAAARAFEPKLSFGPAYDRSMMRRILAPIDMMASTFSFSRAQQGTSAVPHGRLLDMSYAPYSIKEEQGVEAVRPAQGLWSNAQDMGKYLLFELNGGQLKGELYISKNNMSLRRTPQVKTSDGLSYGLGLFIEDVNGVSVMGQGGNTRGYTSDMFFLPEHGVGFVLLTNGGGVGPVRSAIRRKVLELLFDGKPLAQDQLELGLKTKKEALDKISADIVRNTDSSWVDPLLGHYTSQELGTINISKNKKGELAIDVGEWVRPISPAVEEDGQKKLVITGAPYAGLELVLRDRALVVKAGQKEYVFEK